MKSLIQEHYTQCKNGEITLQTLMRTLSQEMPGVVSIHNSLEDVTVILESKGIIPRQNTENLNTEEVFNFTELLKENLETATKPQDKPVNLQAYITGMYVEAGDPNNSSKTENELDKLVKKNLQKDPLYYVKNAQHGIKGLKMIETPAPEEVKGKFKSSGAREVKRKKVLKENLEPSKPETTTVPSKEQKIKDSIKASLLRQVTNGKEGEKMNLSTVRNTLKETLDTFDHSSYSHFLIWKEGILEGFADNITAEQGKKTYCNYAPQVKTRQELMEAGIDPKNKSVWKWESKEKTHKPYEPSISDIKTDVLTDMYDTMVRLGKTPETSKTLAKVQKELDNRGVLLNDSPKRSAKTVEEMKKEIRSTLRKEIKEGTFMGKDSIPELKLDPAFQKLPSDQKAAALAKLQQGKETVTL